MAAPQYETTDFEQVTVATVGIGFTTAKVTAVGIEGQVLCSVETAQIRVRMDGTDPSSSVGFVLDPGTTFIVQGQSDMTRFRAIRTGSNSATLSCQYMRG